MTQDVTYTRTLTEYFPIRCVLRDEVQHVLRLHHLQTTQKNANNYDVHAKLLTPQSATLVKSVKTWTSYGMTSPKQQTTAAIQQLSGAQPFPFLFRVCVCVCVYCVCVRARARLCVYCVCVRVRALVCEKEEECALCVYVFSSLSE